MPTRMQRDCRVCGGTRCERDEVEGASALGLAECTRCGHRWTERAPLALSRPLAWAVTEAAEAA